MMAIKLSKYSSHLAYLILLLLMVCHVQAKNFGISNNSFKFFSGTQSLNALKLNHEGQKIFRFDTFGNERFWGEQLRLHEAIAGEALGGVGPGISPATALALGLKVDVKALPRRLRRALRNGSFDLDNPENTIKLLKLNAVIGLTGRFDDQGTIHSMGVQCALCHSTVDDRFAPGIGRRLDGWANRDLDVGKIIAAAPDLTPFTDLLNLDETTVRNVLSSWGVGKFDAQLLLDGKAFQPDGRSSAVLIPPAFGLGGVNLHTSNGWGAISHWNALVAVLEMGGQGTFYDPRLDDPVKFPIAASAGVSNVRSDPDLVTAKLAALQFYQLALTTPKPPANSFNARAAAQGKTIFNGKAQCSRCHVPPIFTEPGWNAHHGDEIGIDNFHAERGPIDAYRTTPLKGLWTHQKGGFFHDGRFPELQDVVNHYDSFFELRLTDDEKFNLIEYLKSL